MSGWPTQDWRYDPGDMDVNIWPGWEHESCHVEYDKGVTEHSEQIGPADGKGMAPFRYELTCQDCGKTHRFTHTEYVGHEETEETA